jgi:energy-coupling factor transporter ATP-binding protein EcfA2
VKLREDAESLVYTLDSPKFCRAAPLPLAEGASAYAHTGMRIVLWSSARGRFEQITLTEWLDEFCETHSLLLVGRAGAGKSKLLHMLAAELCVGKECDPPCSRYVWAKALDPLGVLSHTGALASAGCLVLTDLTLTTGRNTRISKEELKSLLDVVEGGVIQSCRYRSATINAGMPRVMAVNVGGNSREDYGTFFAECGEYGLAELMNNLSDLNKATTILRRMTDDEVATARRVAICTTDPEQSLITPALLAMLEADTARVSSNRRARRAAYWANRG